MNKMNNTSRSSSRWRRALVLSGFLLTALTAFAQHTAISTLLPPGYRSEEALTWCGPATGQMVVAGYPASACTVVQADVDASIQAHKVEGNWDTDPAGLRAALVEQCPLPVGHSWVVFSPTDATELMYWAAHYMTQNQYPVAVLLGTTQHNSFPPHKEHWATITAIVTDLDPVANPMVTLKFVLFIDPSPSHLGDPPLVRYVSAAVWYAGNGVQPPVLTAVTKMPSAYNGKFVAIIEPPTVTGRAISAVKLLQTGTVIPKAQALRSSLEAVQRLKLTDVQEFREFANAKPLDPLLVNAQRGGYYLVPFSVDQKPPSLAVIVNAYNGEFQEAGRFAPRTFLAERPALEHARLALGLQKPFERGKVKTEMVSSPEGLPYAPEWRITTGNRVLHVGQLGNVREVQSQTKPLYEQ
jgi:hypothetical protein